jgi:DMSO/TMAO reductase YedYZ heme-binding membrane subunit
VNADKLTWYVARSGGIVAWSLLAFSLILGLLLSSRILGRRGSPAWILSIHRFLGGLGVIFTAVHVAAVMVDDFVDFGLADVLVPWASAWRPGATAWGIIAMYLMVAIELTSFAMRRIPKAVWRSVHWMSAPLFVVASMHGYQSGADAGRAFVVAISAVVVALTILTAFRVRTATDHTEARTATRVPVADSNAGVSGGHLQDQRHDETERLPAPSLYDEQRELILSSDGSSKDETPVSSATTEAAAPPPTPAWRPGVSAESDDPLAWIRADTDRDPRVRRRPGPSPGVWKRSERDLDSYR